MLGDADHPDHPERVLEGLFGVDRGVDRDCVPRLDAVVSHYLRKTPASPAAGGGRRARDDGALDLGRSARPQDVVAMSLDLTWQRAGSSWDSVAAVLGEQGPGSMAIVLVDRVNASRHGFLLRNHDDDIIVIETQEAKGSRVRSLADALPPVDARVAVIDATGRQVVLPEMPRDAADALTDSARKGPRYGSL
ncbi:toxin glutamine deamidase domain-containing protein, partial [Catellatospora citrea]|uniref:toxin glutamine deamidase domain-containing protein n=1 Tax=Catellatospora citrea TaxID=53366 RepID=UPI0019406A4A